MRSPVALIVVGLLLAVSVVASALIVTRGIVDVKLLGTSRLEVTGTAERLVRSDRVKWVASVTAATPASELTAGYRRMSQQLEAVLGVLAERGFEADRIDVAPIEVYPVYRECYGDSGGECVRELISYELRQNLTLNSEQVDEVTALALDALAFSDAGGVLFTLRLEYYTSQLEQLRPELLAAAVGDAQARARAMTESTGATVGPLQAVDSGVFQVTQINSTEVSSLGEYDTSAIDKKVTAVVRATFALR